MANSMTWSCEAAGKDLALPYVDSLLIVCCPVPRHNFIFFCHCLHRWQRRSWECWKRHESIWHGTIRPSFGGVAYFEFVVLLSDSFTVVSKVVQSTECFVLKWETACRFVTCVVRSFLYLDTPCKLCRHPLSSSSILPFSQMYLIRLFQKHHKDIQGF